MTKRSETEANIQQGFKRFYEIMLECCDHTIIDPARLFELSLQCDRSPDGNIAELGVYRGGAAKLLCKLFPHRLVYLFDTFTGLPNCGENDKMENGHFGDVLIDDVRDYLADCPNARIYPGLFPDTASSIDDTFSLVHLDADTYESTKAGLEWFWPRLDEGGIIVLDDLNTPDTPGVKKAAGEFFSDCQCCKLIMTFPLTGLAIKSSHSQESPA